jgi:hypothetical protein
VYAVATCCYSAQSACNKPRHDKPLSAHPNRQQTYARIILSFVLYCGAARCCLTSRKTYCRLVDKYVHRSFSGPVANVAAGAIKRGLCIDVWLGMSTESDRPCTGGYCIMVLHHRSSTGTLSSTDCISLWSRRQDQYWSGTPKTSPSFWIVAFGSRLAPWTGMAEQPLPTESAVSTYLRTS